MCAQKTAFLKAVESESFTKSIEKIPFILGKDGEGSLVIKDLCKTQHIVIAGATGTGKSTLAHSIILSLINKTSPDNLRFILCDTKLVEFDIYRDDPHLLIPPVTDPAKICGTLSWVESEISRRLKLFSDSSCNNISSFNDFMWENYQNPIPHTLLIIDDASAISETKVENQILQKIAQVGRTVGIHLILITQTPKLSGISKLIRNYIPARAVFNVFTSEEEKMLLGSEKNRFTTDVGEIVFYDVPTRKKEVIKCFPISDYTANTIIEKSKESFSQFGNKRILEDNDELKGDEMLPAAVDVILETGQASVSMLQRRLKLGYARAARIVDEMEEKGIVGAFQGSKPRAILITKEQWQEMREPSKKTNTVEKPETLCENEPDNDVTIAEPVGVDSEHESALPKTRFHKIRSLFKRL